MTNNIGPIVALMLLVATINFFGASMLAENRFHVEAVAHGYAHYDLNSEWHWNNDGQKP